MTDQITSPVIIERAAAAEFFTEGYCGATVNAGVAKLAFYSLTSTQPGEPAELRIVCRLALPLGSLLGVHEAMGNMIAELKTQGQIRQA